MFQPANIPPDPERWDDRLAFSDDQPEPPHSAQNELSPVEPIPRDSYSPLFSLYSQIAEDEDNKMTDRWQKDTDRILIFTGFFSVAVAVLLVISVQDLRPNSQDTSAFYLANIYQILADPNTTVPPASIPSTVAIPPTFSPPTYVFWVNSLWFLSFVISLTCGLLATLLRQSSLRYVRLTQPSRCSPEKRARMRAFFANGADKMRLPSAVESLPALIHLSLFLFFAGLAIFLFNINHSVFISMIWWIGAFIVLYGWMTVMPIFRLDSPYYAPLSSAAWSLYAVLTYALFSTLAFVIGSFGRFETRVRFSERYRRWVLGGVSMAAEETALTHSSEIKMRIFKWTIGALGEDDTLLEKFFEGIPSFFNSRLAPIHEVDLRHMLLVPFEISNVLNGFMRRTLSSNSVIESVKNRRLGIYLDAINEIYIPSQVLSALSDILIGKIGPLPQSIDTATILACWCAANNEHIAVFARCLVASVLLAIQKPDDHWIALARDQLRFPEDVLRDNTSTAYRDSSLSLYILVHVARQVIGNPENWDILSSLSKFDIHNTLPELQNEFCAIWNDIVREAQRTNDDRYVKILHSIRHLYIALHMGTDAAPPAFYAHAGGPPPPTSTNIVPDIPSVLGPRSVFVEQLDPKGQDDTIAPRAISDITQVSSKATQFPRSISTIGATQQTSQGSTGVPSITVHDPQIPLIPMAPPPSCLILTEPLPSVESALIQPHRSDHLSHPLGSPPSILSTVHSNITPQVASVLDVPVTTGIGALSARGRDETPHDLNPPTPVEVPLHVQQPGPSSPDISEGLMPPRDDQHDL